MTRQHVDRHQRGGERTAWIEAIEREIVYQVDNFARHPLPPKVIFCDFDVDVLKKKEVYNSNRLCLTEVAEFDV